MHDPAPDKPSPDPEVPVPGAGGTYFPPAHGMAAFLGLCTLLLFILLGGCAAARLERNGDQAMLLGNPVSARWNYEKALDLKPKLASKPQFVGKLTTARRDAEVSEGDTALQRGQWDLAINHYTASLAIDADHAPAHQGVGKAKHAAAQMHYADALAHADEDALDAARISLQRTLDYQPQHADARAALATLDDEAAGNPQAVEAYRRGVALAQQKRWPEAIDAFKAATIADPHHLPSRARLHRSSTTFQQAQLAHEHGSQFASKRQLDEAIAALQQAIQIDPSNTKAKQELEHAHQQRSQADALLGQAREALTRRDWDSALGHVSAARSIYPTHPDAASLGSRARIDAAEHHTRIGQASLQADRMAEADAAFTLALAYLPKHESAHRGRRDVAMHRGKAHELGHRWGAALLCYLDALDHQADLKVQDAIQRMRDRIIDRADFTLRVASDANADRLPGPTLQLQQASLARLGKTIPPVISLVANPQDADLHALLAVASLDITSRLESSQARTHDYDVAYEVPNPEIPRLEALIHACAADVHALRHRYDRLWRAYCNAQARAQQTCDPHDIARADRLKHQASHAKREWRSAESKLSHLRHQLSCEPVTITQIRTEQWPYRVETHRQTGRLLATVTLEDARGPIAKQHVVDRQFSESDTTIDRPNPEIGLREDPLMLSDPADIQSGLISRAADETARHVIHQAIAHRAAELQAQAGVLSAEGRDADALELRVDAAIVAGQTDGRAETKQLDALRGK